MQQAESQGPKVGVFAIFLTFSRVTLSSFGSPLFWARRALVERQHWLTEREFVDLLALGQLLPGPNVLNLAALGMHAADEHGFGPGDVLAGRRLDVLVP